MAMTAMAWMLCARATEGTEAEFEACETCLDDGERECKWCKPSNHSPKDSGVCYCPSDDRLQDCHFGLAFSNAVTNRDSCRSTGLLDGLHSFERTMVYVGIGSALLFISGLVCRYLERTRATPAPGVPVWDVTPTWQPPTPAIEAAPAVPIASTVSTPDRKDGLSY